MELLCCIHEQSRDVKEHVEEVLPFRCITQGDTLHSRILMFTGILQRNKSVGLEAGIAKLGRDPGARRC